MKIQINKRLCPISHRFGSSFLILGTTYSVKIYPGLLVFNDLNSTKIFKVPIPFSGPVSDFCIIQDIKKALITVSFHTKDGYLSYKILSKDSQLLLQLERSFKNLGIKLKKRKSVLKTEFILPIKIDQGNDFSEQIFLGVHKKQEIDLINKRKNLPEILPFVFLLSQFYSDIKSDCIRKKCIVRNLSQMILDKNREGLDMAFHNVFNVHFFESFIPRVNDDDYQNIIDRVDEKNAKPLHILRNLFYIIKSLFIQLKQEDVSILPSLPLSFHHGRALNIQTRYGSFDIEWSKKLIKKMIFQPFKDCKIRLVFQSKIKKYRLKEGKEKKSRLYKNKQTIFFKKNHIYFFDRFQK